MNKPAKQKKQATKLRNKASNTSRKARIALACDWLTTPGGAEKVLLELHRIYPDAPIYTSQYSKKGINWFADAEVHTGWLQIFPVTFRKILGPLRQIYFSHLDLSAYDLVISVTGAEAKSIKAKRHLCYCHVPTQYYWQMYDKYLDNPGFGILNPLVRFFFKLLVKPLRQADYQSAQRPDQFVTISTYAQDQIQKYYHRDSIIIAPPVDITKFSTKKSSKSTVNPQPNGDFCTKNQTFCTSIPQNNNSFSTENSELSTSSPQETNKFYTKSSDFSTKSQKLSTKDLDLSTADSKLSTHTSKKSTDSSQKSTNNPQKIQNYPQVFHNQTLPTPKRTSNPHAPAILPPKPFQYYVIACRQVTWKKIDLAIQACQVAQVPLLVIGDGPEHQRLLKIARETSLIRFLPWLQPDELAQYLQNAKAYLFPSLEPFGIAAVEALAAGCPVIAYQDGGSRDFIIDGKNGILFEHQTVSSLKKALKRFEQLDFDRKIVTQTATEFSTAKFCQHITQVVDKYLYNINQHQKKGTKHENH